ncbi:MAG: hypothetical protein ACR2QC_11990 [Gammaproteobacteria bacterium]
MHSEVKEPIEVEYPFVYEEVTMIDEEGDYKIMSWRPGVLKEEQREDAGHGHFFPIKLCHGMGKMIITQIATAQLPGRYWNRVFYLRQWRDPDGKVFGRKTLRMTTDRVFKDLCSGYRHAVNEVAIGR